LAKREKCDCLILVNGIRYCTGSLINTTANDSRPIFLTADHCLGGWATANKKYDAISDPNLDHWSFYWNYEAPSCINPTEEPTIYSTVGATILANNGYSDFALLSLKEDPRSNNSIKLYYLGWDRSGDSGNGGVGIHHPNGDIKKISQYTLTPQSTVYAENSTNSNGTHWRLIWSKGVTEGGSSGSPLINSNRKVIGQLHGGYSDCISNGIYGPDKPDWYGKFSVSWTGNGATDNRRKLQPWLDPRNTGAIVLDGKGTVPDTPADLLIRDYVGDDGEEPSYGYNGWLYNLVQHNPDIKLLDIDTQQPIHSIGMYKKKNCYIAVNIKNIGGKTTEGNGKERLHLFSQSYLITTLPKYALPYYERLTPTKGLPIGKLAYNEQKVAAGLFNWELPEKKLKATAERLKKAFPSVNNPIWGFDILAIADENGNSIIKSTADTIFIAHGAEDIARRYNSAAMGYWQRRTLWDDIFNQIIRILPTANVPFSLSLSQPVDIKRGRIKDFAEVNILLSNSLMTKLITAGNTKIKVIDQNRVRLLSADAKLDFRPMSNNKEDYFAGVEVKFFSDLLPQINSFDFGLSYSEQGKEPEMVHFTAIRDSSVYFKAQAEASKTQVAGNETVTLTATNIGDEATYTWYNRSGNVIGTGTSITTVPTSTDTYTLEVEREDNGYKSYGEVEVIALAGKIVSLSPNPAHSTLTVKYKLPDNAVIASIQITNIQNNISKTYAISTTATEKTISLEGLSVGSYIVKLIADGKTLHSQNLLIK
jgi:lysyl endopeptidase (lys-C)